MATYDALDDDPIDGEVELSEKDEIIFAIQDQQERILFNACVAIAVLAFVLLLMR